MSGRGLHLHFEPTSGIAGDMAVAALVDAGVPAAVVMRAVEAMGVRGLRVAFGRRKRGAYVGRSFDVSWPGQPQTVRAARGAPASAPRPRPRPHRHDHDHGDHEETGAHSDDHRDYVEIKRLVTRARLDADVRALAADIFARVAEVEAELHGTRIDRVAFHEVGAYDSIADVVGVAAAIVHLAPASIGSLPPVVGTGVVRTAHGPVPVPAPATAALLREIPIVPEGDGELTTPTGAAILAAVVDRFGPLPPMRIGAIGYGAGTRELSDRANVLRVTLGEPLGVADAPAAADVVLVEANVDDMSPQLIDPLCEALFAAGAVDVWSAPILMKKGRPAVQVSALAPPAQLGDVERAFFAHSTTLGLRRRALGRVVLARSFTTVETPYGRVRIKLGALDGEILGAQPEFDDCRRLAARAHVPVREVLAAAASAGRALLPQANAEIATVSDEPGPAALDGLARAAQVLAVGTGESQLHAAAEHVARALGATSVSLLAMLADPEAAYLVADSGEIEIGRVRLPLGQHPHLKRAIELGEVTVIGGGEAATGAGVAGASDASAVFPVLIGRKPAGALVARFDGAEAARLAEASVGPGRVAASLLGIVLRGAKALEPLRERTRRVTLPDVREERRVRAIERYRAFIDSASDGIIVVDAAGAVLYMNRAAEEVTGYARDGLSGKPITQIVPEAFRPGLEHRIARAIADDPVDNFDLDLVTTSGDRITVSVASIAILSEHEAAIFSFRDVTLARDLERELRRTSEFLKRILNSVVDGVIAANMRGTIVLFNQGAERICGYKATDVIGKMSVKRFYPAGVAHEVMRLIRSAEHGGGGRLEPVRRDLVTAAGERVPVSISAALVLDDEGREIATVGIFSDQRDRIRMEERLASAQEKLAVSEKQAVAVELAGAAAHELNQPLTSVMGYAQVLMRKLGPDAVHLPIVQTILEEADRMAAIVRKLGSVARYETKSYVGGAQIIDLDRAAQENFPASGETGKKEGT